jgi:hypothetical protein
MRSTLRSAIARASLPAALLLLAAGCRDTLAPAVLAPTRFGADQFLAQAHVAPGAAADVHHFTARLTAGATAGRVGGFRARVMLPAGVTLDDATARGADGVMRVVNQVGHDVVVVGVSPDGLAGGDLFTIALRGPAAALGGVRLAFDELVDAKGADRQRALVLVERAR